MNETQLREELVDAYSPVQLPDPVDDIMRRGRAIHRSRRAPLLGLLVAVSAVALVLASPLASPPSAFATWSTNPTTISSVDESIIASRCGDCTVIKHNGSWAYGTAGAGLQDISNRQKMLNGATALQLEGSSDMNNVHDRAQAASAWGWVAPAVASVVVRADGHTSQATVRDGAFAAWWPHGEGASRGGVVTAYDGAGRQLAQVTITGFEW